MKLSSLCIASILFFLTIGFSLQGADIIPSEKNISVIARTLSNKKSAAVLRFIEPAPLNGLSAAELKSFPGAIVAEAAETEALEPGKKIRVRILKTNFKYPALRTEEIIDVAKNSVVSRHEMVASHFLVTLAPGEDPQTFLKRFGPQATSIVKVPADAPLYRVNLASSSLEALPMALDQAALATAGVSEPDFIAHGADVSGSDQGVTSNDPFLNNQWGLWKQSYFSNSTNGPSTNNFGSDAVDAWKIRTDASSIIVAVIDSGIRYTHEDLAANMWDNPDLSAADRCGTNVVASTGDPMDDSGHGTHCAGIIGAVGNNGVGISGVAWKVQLMACKSSNSQDNSTYSDAVTAIEYARSHGANILNCSWGGNAYSQILFNELSSTRDAGMIVVTCAMNNSQDNDEVPFYPANYALDNIVSVAAMGLGDQLADFSDYGATTVDLAAPGVYILSTWNTNDSSYVWYQGTSMAAPFVTGAFALLTAEFPMESYQSLIACLLASTDKIPALAGKTISGGRLNIYRALKEPAPFPFGGGIPAIPYN